MRPHLLAGTQTVIALMVARYHRVERDIMVGTDIHGWVEYRHPDLELWIGVIKLAPLLSDRNYPLFAWLFDVHKAFGGMQWDFSPLAARRGLPPDASAEAATEYAAVMAQSPEEVHGTTWISWREVQAIDWDEPIEDMICESRLDRPGGIYSWRSQFLQHHADLLPDQAESLQPGQRWTVGDQMYEVVAMRRRDVLEEPWELLFRLMVVLASRVEDTDHLRWVVWFDG
jgi:hypothetical protein